MPTTDSSLTANWNVAPTTGLPPSSRPDAVAMIESPTAYVLRPRLRTTSDTMRRGTTVTSTDPVPTSATEAVMLAVPGARPTAFPLVRAVETADATSGADELHATS